MTAETDNENDWRNYFMIKLNNFKNIAGLAHRTKFFSSVDFFLKINFFKKLFQEYYQSVKQFGSRSGPTFCQVLGGWLNLEFNFSQKKKHPSLLCWGIKTIYKIRSLTEAF